MTPSIRIKTSRKCTYLIQSRHGVFLFRWNIIVDGKHHQPRISLKTRDYLEALAMASSIAIKIKALANPTLADILAIYDDFKGESKQSATLIKSLDIESKLADLAPKSRLEYRNCWLSFLSTLDPSVTINTVRQSHVEHWKAKQTCSETTLKKKLRLLSSCFSRLGVSFEPEWCRLKIKSVNDKSKRALTQQELEKVLSLTQQYRPNDRAERVGAWKYYLPRLAALTGCRLNELAQMRVGDVNLNDKPFISINSIGTGKRLKNRSSHREIPISTSLQSLLLPLIQGRDKAELLFDDLPYREVGGYAPVTSKWFSSLFKEAFDDTTITFHSIRHYVVTTLFNNNYHEDLIAELVGHSIGKRVTGKVYMSGFSYELKLAALSVLTPQTRGKF
ncbi:TPA: tyrosine-type recombinase/integrase [Vibrio parahaemolyticus]|nr:tyrosine-type recombinase/integrase [Vibrio parahaemolyticus]HCM1282094.1 tyrosine-type recombinase/integrase [Vibrio parahaemolyticus]